MRHHMTPDGPVPFTPEEEAEWDAREAEFEATAADRAWAAVREQRNQLLTSTDWWVTKAAEEGIKISSARKAYRQALRDITTQSDPFDVVWPVNPDMEV